jgi:hypothetical protein
MGDLKDSTKPSIPGQCDASDSAPQIRRKAKHQQGSHIQNDESFKDSSL